MFGLTECLFFSEVLFEIEVFMELIGETTSAIKTKSKQTTKKCASTKVLDKPQIVESQVGSIEDPTLTVSEAAVYQ